MKLRTYWVVFLFLLLACAIGFWGCGNSAVTISFPGGKVLAIDQGQSLTITATTANDSGEGVSWACTGAACTALTGATTTQVTFTASGATGTATITATSVKQNTITGTVTITVNALPTVATTPSQVTAAPATGGSLYSFTLSASGGSGTLTWSATGLPVDGLSLNSATGVISGTPTAHGSFVVMLTVTDTSAAGAKTSSTVTVTITVNNPPPPAITTIQSQVSGGAAGIPYSFTFQATGTGALTWSAVGLSDGLAINPSTGTISGIPTSPAMVSFTLTASDTYGQSSAATAFVITVSASYTLAVADLGTGNGSVTSNAGQIACTDAGGVVTGICSALYANGTVVTLTAAATGTSKFNMWGGACSGTGTCMVTMNAPVSVTASFSPPPASVTLPPFTPTNAVQTASFNCTSGPSCTDANSHTLQLAVGGVTTPFTMTVTATEVPLSQADGICESGNTPSTDFDCRFASYFGALQGNGDVDVPQCDAYANGNCVFYSVYYCVPQGNTCVPTPGQEPPPNMYQSPVNWQIEFNDTSYTPPAGFQTTPRLFDDPDYAVSSTAPYGTNCTTPMTLNGSPTSPAIFCQFLFDITTNPDIAGRTLQFNDVVVAFPRAASVVTPNLNIVETADVSTISAGNPIGFTTAITNSSAPGTGPANTVTLTDSLPAGTNINWSISPANSACSITGAVGSQVLNCAFGNLAPANTASVHMVSASSSIGLFTNMATASAANNTPSQISASAAINVTTPLPPVITTTPAQLPSATVNSAYNFTFQGSGYAPLTWSTTPALSDSLSLNPSTGAVTGTPTTATTLNFSVTITDGIGQQTTVSGFSIVVSTESVAFTPSAPTAVTAGNTLSVAANVSTDPGNGGVDWMVTCGSASCGSFNPTHTASGASTTYTAPSNVPTGNTVTITATATDAPKPQQSAVVTINYTQLAIQTSSLPSAGQNVSYSATITASGGLPPYTFSLDAGSATLPNGLQFNPSSPSATITGTPTATGTTNNIIVDVKDSEGTPMTAQKTYSIAVNTVNAACDTGSESILSGPYAFQLQGFDTHGPVALIGSFTADGTGKITAGEEDINNSTTGNTPPALSIITASSSYSVGQDTNGGYRGCMTVATSTATSTYHFVLNEIGANTANVAGNGRLMELDSTGTLATGVMRQQTASAFSNAQVSGNYAFGASSTVSITQQTRYAIAGTVTISGTTFSNGQQDQDENISGSGAIIATNTFTGTRGTPDSFGRTAFTITTAGSGGGSSDSVYYIVSAGEVLYMSADAQSEGGVSAGMALKQSGGPFSNSSFSGTSVVYTTGLDETGSPSVPASDVEVGLFNIPSTGNFTYNSDENDGGTLTSNTDSGTYSVASNGRVTLTSTGSGQNHPPVLYLVSPGKGFIVGTDSVVSAGFFEPQTGSPFTLASINGVFGFGTVWPAEQNVDYSDGWADFSGSGTVSGANDDVSLGGGQDTYQTFSQAVAVASNGRGTVGVSSTPNVIFYIVSPTKSILMDAYNESGTQVRTDPAIQVAEHQ